MDGRAGWRWLEATWQPSPSRAIWQGDAPSGGEALAASQKVAYNFHVSLTLLALAVAGCGAQYLSPLVSKAGSAHRMTAGGSSGAGARGSRNQLAAVVTGAC